MKIKNLSLAITTLIMFSLADTYSQQWTGSLTNTGHIERLGTVNLIGTSSSLYPAFSNDNQFVVYSNFKKHVIKAVCNETGQHGFNANTNNASTIAFSVTKNTPLFSSGPGVTFTPSNDETFVVLGDGRVFATELTIKKAPVFPDYVFNTDYNLLSLYQIENYIKLNHRLPGIPSATEVAEKGLSVGTMQVLQMEKIEELTLHMIDLKKENDELKKQNAKLQADIELIKEKLGMTK